MMTCFCRIPSRWGRWSTSLSAWNRPSAGGLAPQTRRGRSRRTVYAERRTCGPASRCTGWAPGASGLIVDSSPARRKRRTERCACADALCAPLTVTVSPQGLEGTRIVDTSILLACWRVFLTAHLVIDVRKSRAIDLCKPCQTLQRRPREFSLPYPILTNLHTLTS